MKLKFLFLVAAFMLFGIQGKAQLADYLKLIEIEQMQTMKDGLLLIPFGKENTPKDNDRVMSVFEKFYSYSSVGFFTPEKQDQAVDSLPDFYMNTNGEVVLLDADPSEVFVLRIYDSRFDLREQFKLVRKKDEPVIDPIPYRIPKTDFEREQQKYSPNNTKYGGLFLEKYLPVEKKLTKNKKILFNRYFFSRFHEELDPQTNFERAVKHLQDQLVKREEELKKS